MQLFEKNIFLFRKTYVMSDEGVARYGEFY